MKWYYHNNKKNRTKIKQRKIRNKKLCKKYPWLIPRNWRGKKYKDYDYSYHMLDDIKGWWKCFGEMMCEELLIELKRTHHVKDFRILEYKEKYGEMVLTPSYYNETIGNILRKYEVISRNVCMLCGKPDVAQTTRGWILPLCEKCWLKFPYVDGKTYEEDTDYENRMISTTVRWKTWYKGKTIEHEKDISDTVQKIRSRYAQRLKKMEGWQNDT